MGLREQILVLIGLLAVGSWAEDHNINGKNLSWIYDIRNSATTQNQDYKLDPSTGAYQYHFDVSAVDSFKFETKTKDAVTFGCYGWKDQASKWHGTNYVADSHGRRDVRDVTKPVNVFTSDNKAEPRTFLENLPQCLAFAIESPPLMMYVYTTQPPIQRQPTKVESHDHVPHSSEQVHKIHKGEVPAYSGPFIQSKKTEEDRTGKGPISRVSVTPPAGDLVAKVIYNAQTLVKSPPVTGIKVVSGRPNAVITTGEDLLQTDTKTPILQTETFESGKVPSFDLKTVASTEAPSIAETELGSSKGAINNGGLFLFDKTTDSGNGLDIKGIPTGSEIGVDLGNGITTGSLELGKVPSSVGSFQVTGGLDVTKGTTGSGIGVGVGQGITTGSVEFGKGSVPSSIGSSQVTTTGSGGGLDVKKGITTGSGIGVGVGQGITTGSLEFGKVPGSVGSFQVTGGSGGDLDVTKGTTGSGIGAGVGQGITTGSLEFGKVPSSIGSSQVTTMGSGGGLDVKKGITTGSGIGVGLGNGITTGSLELVPSSVGSFQVTKGAGGDFDVTKGITIGSGIGVGVGQGITTGSLEFGKGSVTSSDGSFQVTKTGSGGSLDVKKGITTGSGIGVGIDTGISTGTLEFDKGSVPTSIGSLQVTTTGSGGGLVVSKGITTSSGGDGGFQTPQTIFTTSVGQDLTKGSSTESNIHSEPNTETETTSSIFGFDPSKWSITNTLKTMVNKVVNVGQKIFGITDGSDSKVTTGSTEDPIKTGVSSSTPAVGGGVDIGISSTTLDIPFTSLTGQPESGYKVDIPSKTAETTTTSSIKGKATSGFKIIEATLKPLPTLPDLTAGTPTILESLGILKNTLLNKIGISTGGGATMSTGGILTGSSVTQTGSTGSSKVGTTTESFKGTTSRPVSELHIDVTEFVPTSSSRPVTPKPVATSGVTVSTSGSVGNFPQPPQLIGLTNINKQTSKLGENEPSSDSKTTIQTTVGSSQSLIPGFGISVGTGLGGITQEPGVGINSQGPTVTTIGEFITSRPVAVTSPRPGSLGLDVNLPVISPGSTVSTIGEFVSSQLPLNLLDVSPFIPPSSTTPTFGGNFAYSPKPTGSIGFGSTTPSSSDFTKTVTAKYLPPEAGGQMCSCVCPRVKP